MRLPLFFDAPRPATHLFYAAPTNAEQAIDASNPKWIQLCTAGSYVYGDTPVTITADDFDRMIANFRESPAYKPDGRRLFGAPPTEAAARVLAGPYGVIALNFDHPPQGGPRPGHGWFVELERRGDQLWGLCWFDAEAHAGLVSGAWKWTSIEWQGDVTNNKGQRIGPYLSGVALTNDPFITGMQPIQMSRPCPGCGGSTFGGSPPPPSMVAEPTVLTQEEQAMVDALGEEDLRRFADYPWEECIADQKKKGYGEERASKICGAIKAKNAARMNAQALAAGRPVLWFGPATDVLCELRRVFRLPESADVGSVIGEVAKLRSWALGQAAPPIGVDIGGLTDKIRALLNLPTLSDAANIFGELDKLLGALADEQEKENVNAPAQTTPNAPAPGLGLARLFASRFSAMLRTAVAEDETSLVRAFEAMSASYDEAMNLVGTCQRMFGTTDPKVMADKMASLMAIADQLKSVLGEAAADNVAEEKAEGEMAAQDVQQVMAAQRLDPRTAQGTYQAYLAQRLGQPRPLTAPTDAEIAKNPGLVLSFVADVRRRREERPAARQRFFDAHGFSDLAKLQEQMPPHLRGALVPALFAAGGHFSAPQAGPAQGGQQPAHSAPMQFGGPGPNLPFTPGGPVGNVWTMARIQGLPPVPGKANGGTLDQRLAAELNRVEFDGKAAPGTREYDLCWQRVNAVLAEARSN